MLGWYCLFSRDAERESNAPGILGLLDEISESGARFKGRRKRLYDATGASSHAKWLYTMSQRKSPIHDVQNFTGGTKFDRMARVTIEPNKGTSKGTSASIANMEHVLAHWCSTMVHVELQSCNGSIHTNEYGTRRENACAAPESPTLHEHDQP